MESRPASMSMDKGQKREVALGTKHMSFRSWELFVSFLKLFVGGFSYNFLGFSRVWHNLFGVS